MTPARFVSSSAWLPLGWMAVFLLLPVAILLRVSFSEPRFEQPPYTELLVVGETGRWLWEGTLQAWRWLFEDPTYRDALLGSLAMASLTTLVCLLLSLPMAWAIARAPLSWRTPLLLAVILPFWTSFLIRVYAWISLLKPEGLINATLTGIGIIDAPLLILHTNAAVLIGMTYAYLPFMILPLYATFVRIEDDLLQAAADLGATPWQTFMRISLPLAWPGVLAGCLLVFIPAMGDFVVPDLLGGPDNYMLGTALWNEFFRNADWPTASALALTMLLVLLAPLALLQRLQRREEVPT
ncbi:MAG: ABC transporter permease [Gammaproteobacteria bacterium]|nr:ABC transporter permease [Gammaproteobacteria bacterium]